MKINQFIADCFSLLQQAKELTKSEIRSLVAQSPTAALHFDHINARELTDVTDVTFI